MGEENFLIRLSIMISKTTTVLFILLAFIFLFSNIVNAEVRVVHLTEELQAASIITPAKIVSYNADVLKFQPIGSTDIMSARYSTDPTWNPSRFIHTEWPPKDKKTSLTAEWPPVGAEVLIVIDKENVISIFAWPFGEKYRFWSPMMTGSAAGFNCKTLGAPIELISKDDPDISWDGCLVDKSRITSKGISLGIIPSAEFVGKSSKTLLLLVIIAVIIAIYFIIRRQRKI